jgi:hypothetical protein
MADQGKWNFKDDAERRLAIVEEREAMGAHWVKHLVWGTVVVLLIAGREILGIFK